MQCPRPVESAPGQQAGAALPVFGGGKRLNWQGHATGGPGVPAVPSSRCHLWRTRRPTLFKNTKLPGGEWGLWGTLRTGGSGSFSSPWFPQVPVVSSPALVLTGSPLSPFWIVIYHGGCSPKSHLCPPKQPPWHAWRPTGVWALPARLPAELIAHCTHQLFTLVSIPAGRDPGRAG